MLKNELQKSRQIEGRHAKALKLECKQTFANIFALFFIFQVLMLFLHFYMNFKNCPRFVKKIRTQQS